MKRVLVGLLLALAPSAVSAQTGFTTRQIKEFDDALTNAGRFGVPRYTTVLLPTCALTNRGAVAFDTSTLSLKVCDGSSWGAVAAGAGPYDVGGATNAFARVEWNTTQTPDTGMFLTGTTSNHWVIAERQDSGFDFAHAATTDPTLFIHSRNQSTAQWLSIAHDGADSQITSGTGKIVLRGGAGGNVQIFSGILDLGGSVLILSEASAVLQLGADLSGAPIGQTLKAHDGITGTDIAGANLTTAGGRGTGAGQPGDLIIQTGTQLGTGTTAQTLVTRFHAEGGTKTLTDATATTVFTVTTGNDLSCGGTMFFTVEAADATNQQTTSGSVNFAAADNTAGAGGEACTAAVTGTNASAVTSGTLTVTSDATTGTDICNIRLTATGSLTETVGPRVRYSIVFNPTSSTCAVTPQ